MKNVMKLIALSAMMIWGVQAMAQTRGAIFFGASIPTGDFAKFDNMSDFALTSTNPADTYAGAAVGFNAGIKWYFNVGVKGLGVMLSLDGFYNGPNSDLKTAYRQAQSEEAILWLDESFNYTMTPKIINTPAMLGMNYIYAINEQLSVFAEAGLGGNLRFITDKESVGKTELLDVEMVQITTKQDYDKAFTLAYQFGAGVEVAKNLVVGIGYYGLGQAEVKGEKTTKTRILNSNNTNTKNEYVTLGTVDPSLFVVRVGFSF